MHDIEAPIKATLLLYYKKLHCDLVNSVSCISQLSSKLGLERDDVLIISPFADIMTFAS